MHDIYDVIKNVEGIYDSNTSFQVLKDFERVLDEVNLYVYANWEDGELAAGPKIDRHWVTCSFYWPRNKMPDPRGGKRLLDYDCKVTYQKDHMIVPRQIKEPGDIRPGTKKGKLDRKPIWIVEIMMPKKLIADMFIGYTEKAAFDTEAATEAPTGDIATPEAGVPPAPEGAPPGGAEAPTAEAPPGGEAL